MHWGQQARLKAVAYTMLKAELARHPVKIKTPCLVKVDVFKVGGRRGDAHNLVTCIDKLFLDALTLPQGRKTRGLGLIPDDSPEYMTLGSPTVHMKAAENKTILTFVPTKPKKKGK